MNKKLIAIGITFVFLVGWFSGCSEQQSNEAPIASCSANITSGELPLTVSFLGSGNDNDGSIVRYFWSFGDGFTTEEQNPIHTFKESRNYTVRLTVIDNKGAMGDDTININVIEEEYIPTQEDVAFIYWINSNIATITYLINQITDSINNESFMTVQTYCADIIELGDTLPDKINGFTVSSQMYPLGEEFLLYLYDISEWSAFTYGWIVSFEDENIEEANERIDQADYYGNLSIGHLDNITKMMELYIT